MRYVVICSPGGSGLKDAIDKRLLPFLTKSGITVLHEDVEDTFCKSYAVHRALDAQGVPAPQAPNVGDVTRYLPRTQVIEFWKHALRQSIASLNYRAAEAIKGSSEGSVNLLTCHLDLYGGRRRELYSPLDIRALAENGHVVTHVLLLIDDIYDMYFRLARPAFLYDEAAGIAQYVHDKKREADQSDAHPGKAGDDFKALAIWPLEWKANVLAALLTWRRAEMLMAEAVAHQLGSHYGVFGVKHSTSAVAHWLVDKARVPVYVSHPISRPRREQRRTGAWPRDGVVEQCNDLQMGLDQHSITCVIPTAIDELRLTWREKGQLLPRLDKRWPVSGNSDFSDTLYLLPGESPPDPEYTYLLLPKGDQRDDFDWSPWLQSLENQIKTEVAFRDHHLVAANSGLLVFRPFYGDGMTPQGVAAEVDHWRALGDIDAKRHAAFVHFVPDVEKVLKRAAALPAGGGGLEYQVYAATVALLETEGFSRRGMAQLIIQRLAEDESFESLLDAGVIPSDVQSRLRQRWPEILRVASLTVLQEQLTLIAMPSGQAAIWIVESYDQLRNLYPEIGGFLRGTAPQPTGWQSIGLALLQQARARGGGPAQANGEGSEQAKK